MPYPPTSKPLKMPNATRPRPILKHVAAVSSASSASPSPGSRAAVHFPPHPAIAATYAAHSADAYDRSPITVAPNECALPERGCPGRTYGLDEEGDIDMADDDGYTESTPGRAWKKSDHAHPRVRILGFDTSYRRSSSRSSSDSSRSDSPALPSSFTPSLIPDLSSSDASEDSDQGAAFAPFLNGTYASSPMSYSSPSSAPATRLARPSLSPKSDPAQLAFLPHPHSHIHSQAHLAPSASYSYPFSSASGSVSHSSSTLKRERDSRSAHRNSPHSPPRTRPGQRTRSRSRVRGSPVRARRAIVAAFDGYGNREREEEDEGCLGGF